MCAWSCCLLDCECEANIYLLIDLNENDEPDRRICESMPPDELRSRLDLDLPAEGKGRDGTLGLLFS